MPDSLEEHNRQVPQVKNAIRNTLQWLKKQERKAEKEGEERGYKAIRLQLEATFTTKD